jgi:hypothetical protein
MIKLSKIRADRKDGPKIKSALSSKTKAEEIGRNALLNFEKQKN